MKHKTLPGMPPSLEKQGLGLLANIFPDAVVFAVNKDKELVFWNEGAEKYLGHSAKSLIGQNCLSGIQCHQCAAGCEVAEYGHINGKKVTLYTGSGASMTFKKYATAFYNEHSQFEGAIEVLIPTEDSQHLAFAPLLKKRMVFHGLVSSDPVMNEVFDLVSRVAKTDVNVLVRGESGSGKELIARAIHQESYRKDKPFMALNCASLRENLLESELFGHVKGAFTGAIRDHDGIISRAEGGTLFLDEVAEIPLEIQAKLLRVIQEREFTPIGSNKVIKANIRIVAATHQSLRQLVNEGLFREDLMYRLRVVPIFIPPLRDRTRDITLLIKHFLAELEQSGTRKVTEVAPDAMRMLLNYPWPGNIRELRNVLEYANAVSQSSLITIDDLPPEFVETKNMACQEEGPGENVEAKKIRQAVLESNGDLARAAKILGMSRTTLWRKRKKYQL
jgi:transcriptional regulator with PAS, ATPase and Fis domain